MVRRPPGGIPAEVRSNDGHVRAGVAVDRRAIGRRDIAEELLGRLEGRVFVAHNVSFDWSFVSAQLGDSLGEVPVGPRLCTVQMSRRLAPELTRRNLDSVATYFNVPIHARHRAYGDAMATARVLLRLLDEARLQGIRDLPTLQRLLSRKRSS